MYPRAASRKHGDKLDTNCDISTTSSYFSEDALISFELLMCFKRHIMQSNAAWEKTTELSVERKASKTSRIALMCHSSELSNFVILIDLKAPNRGLHPDLISDAEPSTN